ncbi:hypothetical protein yc1106_09221 [Curvularia clavata]|uniref:Uncharacterized protein n=1 Tax=Curvularia clavata TaxID=95742 RepID=A0A9Q8ZHA6_CURCL|nr:hypothetical protein yc1106_09221 [Curvularia clavata]
MATGLDELLDFLLSEIALLGVQGASSADFRRFVQNFYSQRQNDAQSNANDQDAASLATNGLGRSFYERTWQWLTSHPDIRIVYKAEVRNYTLSEFEAAELHETGTIGYAHAAESGQDSSASTTKKVQPSKTLGGLGEALRHRIHEKENGPKQPSRLLGQAISPPSARRPPHNVSEAPCATVAIFDEPNSSITAPRVYTSQGRIWQALTGHGIDVKKVPSMEFVLLSLIAARGPAGITQPELIAVSGQDKRSVPHRTDELARKNYISKYPVQANKMRTSLCIHTKFVSQNAFIQSSAVEDVYHEDGTFVVRSFAQLLYNKVGEGGIVPTRTMRQTLGVPMSAWNKRATQGALIRLDQSGMIKRRRIRKKTSDDAWITCIQVLRAPREEDLKNLGFRRTINPGDEFATDPLDESADGDSIMKDLEDDMLDDFEAIANSEANTSAIDRPEVIPPQWTPDHFLPNIVFNAVALGGPRGWDAETLRNRIVGQFWRRPMESYFTRITNEWEKTQPSHIRHLAVIRDQGVTDEKKFLHYVYRTYNNFEKAVELQYAHWEGVTNTEPGALLNPARNGTVVDAWGFPVIKPGDLVWGSGSATLSEANAVVVRQRKYGPRWDNALGQEISYQKPNNTVPKPKTPRPLGRPRKLSKATKEKLAQVTRDSSPAMETSGFSLTSEEKISLGLDPNARLTKKVQAQIIAHREMTGDPTSLPDTIVHDRARRQLSVPLMTKEERVAAGMPARGRLGIEQENKIREERGLPKLVKKEQKRGKRSCKEPTLLSKQQRKALGWKDHGRLPQDLIEGLRQERDEGIALEDSKVIAMYMDEMRAKASTSNMPKKAAQSTQETPGELDEPENNQDVDEESRPTTAEPNSLRDSPLHSISEKRKTGTPVASPVPTKRRRTEATALQESASLSNSSLATFPDAAGHMDSLDGEIITQSAGGVYPSIEEPASPRVEAGTSSRPALKIYIPPNSSRLDHAARMALDNYERRSSPGIYLNPYVRQKVVRGRPRKAIMATFKLPRLAEMSWFVADEAPEQLTDQDDTPHAPGTTRTTTPHYVEEAAISKQPSCAAQSEQPQTEMQHNIQNHTPPPSIADKGVSAEPEELPSNHENTAELTMHPVTGAVGFEHKAKDDDAATALNPGEGGHAPQAVLDSTRKQSPRPIPSVARKIGGWVPINASERPCASPYQSPYAASPTPETRPPSQTSDAAHSGTVSTSDQDDNQTLGDGIHSAIVEAPVPRVPGTKTKGKEHGKVGSQRRFREKVIMDIIKRCNGVFPGGGEILRPFLTLWRERHSNIKEPSLSTINQTLRTMATRPEFGLKHWSFASQNKNTPGTTTRRMYTYAHLNERSPEVLKLAYNMAQYSNQKEYTARISEKSLLYYPEEIRDLIGEVVSYQPSQAAPKDESVVLSGLNPDLEKQINEAKQRRRSEWNKQKRLEIKARRVQNARVEQALAKQPQESDGAPRTKRARLASLNDKSKNIRRAPLYTADIATLGEESDGAEDGEPDAPATDNTGQISLVWTRPVVVPVPENEPVPIGEQSEDEESEDEPADWEVQEMHDDNDAQTHDSLPVAGPVQDKEDTSELPDEETLDPAATVKNTKKRVRIVVPLDHPPNKRARVTSTTTAGLQDTTRTPPLSADEDAQSGSEVENGREGSYGEARLKAKTQGPGTVQRGKPGPPPTLLERLTGLTGDQNDPIYQPPRRGPRARKPSRSRRGKKKMQVNRHNESQYSKAVDQLDEFQKLFFTFVVASSLSGEDGSMDWGLVQSVYANDKNFDLNRARKLWAWVQIHMAKQVNELATSFQSQYLEAYEAGKVAAIEDPETHDWAGLVRWATRRCAYPELTLPILREALQQFAIEESRYENLDRVSWFKATTADRTRTMLQLQYSFTAPLHRSRNATWSSEDKLLKARSWIRANTATPQVHYDANLAHEKFKEIGESTLVNVVGEFVEKQHIRMRKLKRLLPGRNFNFTQALAKKYARLFQLEDFMTAVQVKKKMDAAFVSEDPDMRSYNISRCEADCTFAAIMTMVSEGTVKLIPQLPPTNNEFQSPHPKLSVWGFCEGGYNHRAIDRSRMFWDIHVVPTEKYKFGNPLRKLACSTSPNDQQETTSWQALPEPPLPGKHDPHALLPIWSSIDGQHITWPWWYHVLNLVLQPLIFMAGATTADIQSHCPEGSTELFEIQLVLNWLESVGAVEKTVGGGYITLPGFWGAFGDRLRDTEHDWFTQHVRRKQKHYEKQRLRMDHNMRQSASQAGTTQHTERISATEKEGDMSVVDAGAADMDTNSQILENLEQHDRTVQNSLDDQPSQGGQAKSGYAVDNSPTATERRTQELSVPEPRGSAEQTPETTGKSSEDIVMRDASRDADGHEDIDAEGELDDDA